MHRYFIVAAALLVSLGYGTAYAQWSSAPVYSPGDPGYPGPYQASPYYGQSPYWDYGPPSNGLHTSGSAGRAYYFGQKTN